MKRIIAIILTFSLCFSLFFLKYDNKASADVITATTIGGLSYALMNSWGISFTAGNSSSSSVSSWMTNNVESYVNERGGSIVSVFGGDAARIVAGKLVVGHQIYNGLVGFLNWLSDKFGLSDQDSNLNQGSIGDIPLDTEINGTISNVPGSGFGVCFYNDASGGYGGYNKAQAYNAGNFIGTVRDAGSNQAFTGSFSLVYVGGSTFQVSASRIRTADGKSISNQKWNITLSGVQVENTLSWNGENYLTPTVLNPDKEWTGTIGGQDWPDTNLDELIGSVFEDVADNNLIVEGEVIDVPIPTPTPMPIDPDTPLGEVPWEGLDNNLSDLYNQGLEEIGAIGDAQNAITDAVADQTGALTGALAGNAGIISGAIGQAVSDVQEAISEQTQTLSESASVTAEATESIAESLEDEEIDWQKFDLRGLFPFCIPFDIYNMLDALVASPKAPHVQLPFVIESIGFSYTIDLDFSAFDQVASVMRTMELIVYGIALAWATSKVIKW